MAAKHYVYRNLHADKFSVRYRGIVIEHTMAFSMHNALFKVNDGGRQRVLKEKRKNVHAFVCSEQYVSISRLYAQVLMDTCGWYEVSYNPYKAGQFFDVKSGSPVYGADRVIGLDNKLYAKGVIR